MNTENLRIPNIYDLFPISKKPEPEEEETITKSTQQNTYYKFNAKNESHPMPEFKTDNIYFNLVSKTDIENYNKKHLTDGKTKDSFSLWLGYQPTHHFDILNPPEELKTINTYDNYDISEILRSDYSRLFFDIDIDQDEYNQQEFNLTWEQITNILNNLEIPTTKLHGFVEVQNEDAQETIPEVYKNQLIFLTNPYNTKEFSAHLYVCGYYFDRDDLFELFSQSKNHFNRDPETTKHLSKYIDLSVYVSAGSQKVFRFGLSAKLNKNRPHPEFNEEILEDVINNLNYYVCNKTSLDSVFISGKSKEYNNLKNYLQTLTSLSCHTQAKIKDDSLEDEIEASKKECFKYIAKNSPHAQWYHALIQEMRRYLIQHPQATDKELFDEFKKEKYQYFSNSNNKKLFQPSSINSAIRSTRENPRISISEIFESHFEEIKPKDEAETANSQLKYTLAYFKKAVETTKEYPKIAELLHYTFIFFTRCDSIKRACEYIAYKDKNGSVVCISYDAFKESLKTNPIVIKLELHNGTILKVSLPKIFNMFDSFKQVYYDFCLYSLDSDYLSLYEKKYIKKSNPPKLPEPVKKILNIIATEDDNEVNQNKIDYILKWLAFVVQHPESRNSTALQISTVQGIGKNILSNAICTYLGETFSLSNAGIEHILGNFNGGMDNKLFVVINEVDTKDKEADKLKSIITDSELNINVKYGAQYRTKNTASYILFTNHTDTRTISNGDRRFTFIKSYGLPLPKEEYAEMCVPGNDSKLKPFLQDEFIAYLLNYDLTGYNPCKCEEFDKHLIYEQREASRSVIYQVIKAWLTSPSYEKDYILVNEFIETINGIAKGTLHKPDSFESYTLDEYTNIPELAGFDDDLQAEFGKSSLTIKVLTNILKFEDDKEVEKIKSRKRDETRNKNILRLRNPIIKPKIEPKQQNNKIILTIIKTWLTNKDYILVNDFIDTINEIAEGLLILPEISEFNEFIQQEFKNNPLTITTLNNILKSEDNKDIEKIRSNKRDSSRKKFILKLIDSTDDNIDV